MAHRRALLTAQVTGQEVLKVPGAGHVSCTVEMANLFAHADVAVIDEIQVRRHGMRRCMSAALFHLV